MQELETGQARAAVERYRSRGDVGQAGEVRGAVAISTQVAVL